MQPTIAHNSLLVLHELSKLNYSRSITSHIVDEKLQWIQFPKIWRPVQNDTTEKLNSAEDNQFYS